MTEWKCVARVSENCHQKIVLKPKQDASQLKLLEERVQFHPNYQDKSDFVGVKFYYLI